MVGMMHSDKNLARKHLNDLIAQYGDKFDARATLLRYRLGLLEGVDIFGEFKHHWEKDAYSLTL